MYCQNCKKKFPKGISVCPDCGLPLIKKGGWKWWHTLLLIGGVLLLLGILAILVIVIICAVLGVALFNLPIFNNTSRDFAQSYENVYEYDDYEYEDEDDYDYDYEEDEYKDKRGENLRSELEEEIVPSTPVNSEFILPDSSSRYLSKSDLYGLTAEQCRIARNEIYARHGRMFQDEALQAYFNAFSWYSPTIQPSDFQESMLNAYEIANRDLIVEYEKEQGYR